MTLSIALIYPELLGTYGDRGNASVLAYRAKQRGIDAQVTVVSPGDTLPTTCDVYLMGGGEDNAQTLATDLLRNQQSQLNEALRSAQLIAICAGFQILGQQFPVAGDKFHAGLNMIDVTTVPGSPRIIGEVTTDCNIENIGVLTGFENHGGRTVLGESASPLGKVRKGFGNGIDLNGYVDGYFSGNIISTYLHGPLFARNPQFADYILAKAINVDASSLSRIENDSAELLHKERTRANI